MKPPISRQRAIVTVVASLFSSIPWAGGDTRHPELGPQFEAALAEQGLAGGVWAIVEPDGQTRSGAAGLKNVATGEAMTLDTRVHIGSITKTLLAVGVLQLVSAGKLSLDRPVSELVPTIRFDNPWAPDHPVRVRHLLDHTAGLEDVRLWHVFSRAASADAPLHQAFTRDASVLKLRSRPGDRMSYSNLGYTLAGMVIEAVTGRRYESYLDQNLLAPLGMHDSTFEFVSQVGPRASSRLAWGHFDDLSPHEAVATSVRPAEQFTTTVRDMAVFARFLMSDGTVAGKRIVDAALLRAMGHGVETEAARAGLTAGYRFGLASRDRHGAIGFCHGGNIVGFRAMLCIYPDAARAYFVSFNTDHETADYGRLHVMLVRALKLAPAQRAGRGEPASDIADWSGRYVPAQAGIETFRYVNTVFGGVSAAWDGEQLVLSPLQGRERILIPAGGRLFSARDRTGISHVLYRSEDARYMISDGLQTYHKVPAIRFWLHVLSLVLGCLGLIWFLIVRPAGSLIRKERLFTPATAGAALLLIPVPLFYFQSFMELGELTLASAVLFVVTGTLPLFMLWQLWWSWRSPARATSRRMDLIAAPLVLQWCAVLISWHALPLSLWR